MAVKCPRCGDPAELIEPGATLAHLPRGSQADETVDIYECNVCTVSELNLEGNSVYYRPFTFLPDGSEVI